MVTVTEHQMAIALAREGGIGVIHQFGTIEEEVHEIKKVKRSTSRVIENPLTIDWNHTILEAIEVMKNEKVTSLLVTKQGELCGIFTSRDYLFEPDLSQPLSSVMTQRDQMIVGSESTTIEEAKKILHQHRIEKLPLLNQLGKIAGLITSQDIVKLEEWPLANRDEKGRLRVAAAVGVKDALIRSQACVEAGADVIVLDIAHGHSEVLLSALRSIKKELSVDVLAGNIATAEAAKALIEAGADGLKVGIGPSPVCSTRLVSGSGIPQLTAIMDVSSVAKKFDVPVCADGGLSLSGDIVKALAAGASCAYSGSLFAGTDECPTPIIMDNGKRFKRYMGSASYDSNHERKEHLDHQKYKQNVDVFVEGVSKLVEYKGSVSMVVKELVKGIKSGISYGGGATIGELQQNAEFIQITPSGWNESLTR